MELIRYLSEVIGCRFGGTKEELLDKRLFDFLDEENGQIIKKHLKMRMDGLVTSYELTITQKDGNKLPVLVTGTPYFNEEGNVTGSFALIKEIIADIPQNTYVITEKIICRVKIEVASVNNPTPTAPINVMPKRRVNRLKLKARWTK